MNRPLRNALRRWLRVPDPFPMGPMGLNGNVRIEVPISPSIDPQELRIIVRGPHREAMMTAAGHIHAVSVGEDGKIELHVVADAIRLSRGAPQ